MRAISTVIDVALCLLLVSASAFTLAHAPTPSDDESATAADSTVEVLTATTAHLNYTLATGAARADQRLVEFCATQGPAFRRTTHGTLAGLLADAAIGNVTVRGTELTHTGDGFERAVTNRTRRATGRRAVAVQVIAEWEPYPDAHVAATVGAGPSPPSNADVHAAVFTVPSGLPSVRERAIEAARADGFDGVASAIARGVVTGLFPPDETQLALRGSYPASALTAYRYRRAALAYDTSVRRAVLREDVERANSSLIRSVAAAIERELRRRFGSPISAARTVAVGRVEITVRTWKR